MAAFVVLGFVLAGGLCGAAARLLLARLPRGALVRPGCCEALLAAAWGATGWAWLYGWLSGRLVPLLLGLGWLAVAAGSVDVRHRRLPDALTVPAIPAGLLLLAPVGAAAIGRGVLGAVLGLASYGAVHLFRPTALGAGDVKLAGSLGAALSGVSWAAPVLAAALAGLLTVALAVTMRQRVVPYGPGMLASAWLVLVGLGITGVPLGEQDGG